LRLCCQDRGCDLAEEVLPGRTNYHSRVTGRSVHQELEKGCCVLEICDDRFHWLDGIPRRSCTPYDHGERQHHGMAPFNIPSDVEHHCCRIEEWDDLPVGTNTIFYTGLALSFPKPSKYNIMTCANHIVCAWSIPIIVTQRWSQYPGYPP
jgi:hypothetical protein